MSYAITVCNEIVEITRLINFLLPRIDGEDEIVIQYDETGVTKEVKDYLNVIKSLHTFITVVGFPLNKDFATFKNNLTQNCTGQYIMQIDADELPNEYLLASIKTILETNNVDLIFVPRVNTVEGITTDHIKKWGWQVNERGWLNFPDYQWRVFRRTNEIKWFGKVHERISGYTTFSALPPQEEYALYHPKEISRQERQNSSYENM
jgi:glycosyltransferase involved in cell wall biosynthesis